MSVGKCLWANVVWANVGSPSSARCQNNFVHKGLPPPLPLKAEGVCVLVHVQGQQEDTGMAGGHRNIFCARNSNSVAAALF
jgi:hypothetical protein